MHLTCYEIEKKTILLMEFVSFNTKKATVTGFWDVMLALSPNLLFYWCLYFLWWTFYSVYSCRAHNTAHVSEKYVVFYLFQSDLKFWLLQ